MVSLGEELKRERELREISLREISDATKISVRILDAIEHDNYKILPGGVFNRNFLRAYAGFIGLDPEYVVRKYQQTHALGEAEAAGVGLSPDSPPAQARNWTKWILVTATVVILILLAIFLADRRRRQNIHAPEGAHSGKLGDPVYETTI
jgi:cytoskeletal protein RodZ